MLQLGNKVILKTFNNTSEANEDVEKNENYWNLIGEIGKIIQSPVEKELYASFSVKKRVLVKFKKDLSELGLSCHNEVTNSLWILEDDLERIGNSMELGPGIFS